MLGRKHDGSFIIGRKIPGHLSNLSKKNTSTKVIAHDQDGLFSLHHNHPDNQHAKKGQLEK